MGKWGYVVVVVVVVVAGSRSETELEAEVAARRTVAAAAAAAGSVLGEAVGQVAGLMMWVCERGSTLLMVWAGEVGLKKMLLDLQWVAVQLRWDHRTPTYW